MDRAARTIHVFSGYLLVVGVILAVAPNVLLALVGVAETDEVWIRIVGVLALALALYYFGAARSRSTRFFTASLLGRGFFSAALVLLWLAGNPWQLIIFAGIELTLAAWTYAEMRRRPTAV